MMRKPKLLVAYMLAGLIISLTVGTRTSDAFSSGKCKNKNCEVVLKKGGYLCSFEARDKNRLVEVQLGGVFEPYGGDLDLVSNPFAPPFLFGGPICLAVGLISFDELGVSSDDLSPTFVEGPYLTCGCDAKGRRKPILNASNSFTCVGDLGLEITQSDGMKLLLSFSGTPILGGRKIVDSNITGFLSLPINGDSVVDEVYEFFFDAKGYCVPVEDPCQLMVPVETP